jgi:hypothetical protein
VDSPNINQEFHPLWPICVTCDRHVGTDEASSSTGSIAESTYNLTASLWGGLTSRVARRPLDVARGAVLCNEAACLYDLPAHGDP